MLFRSILLTFEGIVLLVSHDREFMDNVVTSLLVLEGDGVIEEQAGGYSDWQARGGRLQDLSPQSEKKSAQVMPAAKSAVTETPAAAAAAAAAHTEKKSKLSYKDQRELDALPEKIDTLETRQAELEEAMAQPDFYQRDHAEVEKFLAELISVQQDLEAAFERWSALEGD